MTTQRSLMRALLAASALGGLTFAAPAFAQQNPEADDDIIVTGEHDIMLDGATQTGSRLGLDIRETPAAIDVLTQERFLERGLRTSNEALNSAPGVTAIDTGGSPGTLSMRGFSGNSVSTNYDGVHQPSTMVSRNYDSFAFERIEILKGPASVLYGEGALGGAVNFVPKKPDLDDASFLGLGQLGNRFSFRVAADLNVPLNDKIGARAIISYAGSDGYIDRAANETLTANLGLTFEPTDTLSIFIAAEHFWNTNGPTYWGTPLVPSTVAREASDLVSTANGFVLDERLRSTNFQFSDGLVRSDSTWLRSQISWKISDVWTLRNDLTYNNGDRLWSDAEGYSYQVGTGRVNRQPVYIRNPLDFWNERLMLSADSHIAGHRNRFMIGAEHSENDHVSIRRFGGSTALAVNPYNIVAGIFPVINPATAGAGNYTDSGAKIITNAVFGEDAFNLTDKLLIVIGGRYEEMKLKRSVKDYALNSTTNFDKTYQPFSFRAGAVYDLAPKTQIYAQYNQSAAPVGTLVLLSQANSNFELTKGKSAEIGLKSSFFKNRIDMTLSGYWIKQTDIITRDPSNPNISFQGGSQSSRGVEVALAAAVTRDLRVDANFAKLDARFDELIEAGGANRAGKTPPNVPETVFNLFAAYKVAGTPLKVTGGLKRSSHIYGDNANSVKIAGYTVFDASIGYTFPVGDLTLRGRNLTDKLYVEWGGSSTVYIAAPRTVDLTFRTKF